MQGAEKGTVAHRGNKESGNFPTCPKGGCKTQKRIKKRPERGKSKSDEWIGEGWGCFTRN